MSFEDLHKRITNTVYRNVSFLQQNLAVADLKNDIIRDVRINKVSVRFKDYP